MAVPADGSYGNPGRVVYSYPVTIKNGEYRIVQGLSVEEFSRNAWMPRTRAARGARRRQEYSLNWLKGPDGPFQPPALDATRYLRRYSRRPLHAAKGSPMVGAIVSLVFVVAAALRRHAGRRRDHAAVHRGDSLSRIPAAALLTSR